MTLVYITPTSDTGGHILYVKGQGQGFFNAAIDSPIVNDATFNWWIVDTK